MTLSRREFLGTFGVVLVCGAGASLTGCGSSGSSPSETTWTATQDDSLNVLTMQVAGGNVVAMTGAGWAPREGWIQLQLGGGSIPGQEIESVAESDGVLTVKLAEKGDVQSMDMLLTEWRLEGGDASSITGVTVDYGSGDVQELDKSYD